jgi:hypothetical protein
MVSIFMQKSKLKVVNLKTGHAVNSSSSHSIIIVKNPNSIEAIDNSYQDFGWDEFVLKSKEKKLHYISAMISSQYNELDQQIKMTLKKLGLIDLTEYEESTVDHQSVTGIPGISIKDSCDYEIDQNVFREFLDSYLCDNVIVWGGNDNESKNLNIEGTEIGLSQLNIVKNGNTLCFFDSYTGTRVTLCEEEEVKLESPMLLDLKITDYCGITNCGAACYQNSTTNGKHCDMDYIKKMAEFIKENKVMEIAIGGGEPTHHPNFIEIVETLSKHCNVNFTTRNKEFLVKNYVEKHNPSLKNVRFALSIDSISDIDFLCQFKHLDNYPHAQYVVGQNNEDFLERLINKCVKSSISLVLLGWKTTGRGNTRVPFEIKQPYKHILKHARNSNISVDTSFFSLYGHDGIPDRIKITEEGVYSSYIDCVEKRLYKSSYHLDKYKDFSTPSKLDNFFDYSSFDKKKLNVI